VGTLGGTPEMKHTEEPMGFMDYSFEEAMRNSNTAKTAADRRVFDQSSTNYPVTGFCASCAEMHCTYSTFPFKCMAGLGGLSATATLHGKPETRDTCATYKPKQADSTDSAQKKSGGFLDSIMPGNDLGTKMAKGALKGTGKGIKKLWDML